MGQKLIDEIGNKYGFLTVIEKTKNNQGRTAWKCLCECGKEKIVRGTDLRLGKITSCGLDCPLRHERNGQFIDETNQKYGRLQVLYKVGQNDYGKILWHCLCDCGKEIDVIGSSLRNGRTQSCGCYNKEKHSDKMFKDETGKIYYRLKVIKLIQKSPKALWLCQCICGKTVVVSGINLRRGSTKSCGCLNSYPEEQIEQILKSLEVKYVRQQVFEDLLSENNYNLRFDFSILNSENGDILGLIEYNGEQHYKPISFYGGEKAYATQKKHDIQKIEYCKKNNIPLLILNKKNFNKENIINFLTKVQGGKTNEYKDRQYPIYGTV